MYTVLHRFRPYLILCKYLFQFTHNRGSSFFQVQKHNIIILPSVHFIGSSCHYSSSFTYLFTTFITCRIFQSSIFTNLKSITLEDESNLSGGIFWSESSSRHFVGECINVIKETKNMYVETLTMGMARLLSNSTDYADVEN